MMPRRFADSDALYAHADKLVRELQDAPELQCSTDILMHR